MTDAEYANWLENALDLEAREGSRALLAYVREARRNDADPRLRLREGITLAKLEEWGEAIAVLEAVPPGTPFAHLGVAWQARAMLAVGRPNEALAFAQRAALGVPPLAETKTLHGEILFQLGRRDDALRVLRDAVREFPTDPAPKEVLSSYLRTVGQVGEAEALARGVTTEHPHRATGFGRLGEALIDEGKFEEALTALSRAQELAPAHAEWNRLAAHCLVQLGQSEKALELVNRAAQANANSLEFSLNVARLHSTQAEPNVAESVIKRIVDRFPHHAELYALLATAKARGGDVDAADRTLAQGLSHPPVPAWMQDLARQRGLLS
jgi:tetratricopeptide (TPR) repeat protein